MKRGFYDRVAIERDVLSLVNNRYTESTLNGLSDIAISAWEDSSGRVSNDVADLVRNISKRVKLDVDASRDVFDAENDELKSKTSEYIDELKAKLKL